MAPCDGYKRLTRQVANYLEVKLTPCDGYKRLTRQVVNFLQRKFAAGDGYKRLTRPDVNFTPIMINLRLVMGINSLTRLDVNAPSKFVKVRNNLLTK